jgi:hypothetical protein
MRTLIFLCGYAFIVRPITKTPVLGVDPEGGLRGLCTKQITVTDARPDYVSCTEALHRQSASRLIDAKAANALSERFFMQPNMSANDPKRYSVGMMSRWEARTSLKADKLSSKECAHDAAAPPYRRFADFPRPPLLWRGGAATASNCARDALLGSKNSVENSSRNEVQESGAVSKAPTPSPLAIRAMLSIDTLRSDRSTALLINFAADNNYYRMQSGGEARGASVAAAGHG